MSVETIRLGGYAPESSTHTRALRHLAARLDAEVGADVSIEVVPNVMDPNAMEPNVMDPSVMEPNVTELGRPATDLLSMTESGELTLCYFSTSYLCDRVPELGDLERPYLFGSLAEAHAALDGELGRRLARATERDTGFEVLGFWDNGFRHFTNGLRPVRTPADVVGMRVRLQPNQEHAALIAFWGGIPVTVELSEGIRMIRDGEVDAQENPLANTVAYGVDAVHRHVTMTGHLYGARGVFADRAALEKMPRRVADAIRSAAAAAVAHQRGIAADYELELRERMEHQGVEFVDLTEAQKRAFAP